ncbi:MAG: AtpZ/AtpI family protein [Candidatus Aminicenantes bacterium]|jgi:ATP synthase protein I
MSENNQKDEHRERQKHISRDIGRKAERKLEARKHKEEQSLWFGLGMFGLVGWSVAIPTLIGVAVGIWVDSRYPSPFSWTLICLFIGIVVGCLNAWYWVSKERGNIQKRDQDKNE